MPSQIKPPTTPRQRLTTNQRLLLTLVLLTVIILTVVTITMNWRRIDHQADRSGGLFTNLINNLKQSLDNDKPELKPSAL